MEHEGGLLPKSRQFEDTGRTLGISSRGFAFTGMTTDNQGHDNAIHSDKSLLYDDRQSNEYFVEDRSGSQANPAFKGGEVSFQTTGRQPDATAFTASAAAPAPQGGTGPTWWDRIRSAANILTTQSKNNATKPPEKFQIGLRASNTKPAKVDQKFPQGKGPTGPSSGSIPLNFIGASGGVIGSISR